MNTQKNDPLKKGQNVQEQDKNKNLQNKNESVNKRPQQGQEEEEGTKLPGRETRTPVAGQGQKDSGKDRGAL